MCVNVTGSVYPEVINMPLHTHSRTSSIGGGRRGVLLSHKGQGRDNYSARETSAKEENICTCVRKGRSSIRNAHAIAVTFISRIVGFQNSRQRFARRIAEISDGNFQRKKPTINLTRQKLFAIITYARIYIHIYFHFYVYYIHIYFHF